MWHSDSDGCTVLHSAVLRPKPATLAIMLQNGADAETRSDDDWPPVRLAGIIGSCPIVAVLLDPAVDISARSKALYYKSVPLQCAAGPSCSY